MAESPRRQQHLVSKGYQRNFAKGWRVAVLDAHSGVVLDERRLIRENWTIDDFMSVVASDGTIDDSLEREIAAREQRFLNVIREIRPDAPTTADQKAALDELAAVHLTRSQAYADAFETAVQKTLAEQRVRLPLDERAVAIFIRQWGRRPRPGELEAIADEVAEDFASDSHLFPVSIRKLNPGIQQQLAGLTVRLVESSNNLPGFVLPDNPVLHSRRAEGRFGFRAAGAISDADMIIVPVRRRLVAFYSSQRLPNVRLRTKNSVRWINSLLVRSALKEVACHPGDSQEISRLITNLDRYPPGRFDAITIH